MRITAQKHPQTALLLVALAAACIASYPVVFFGRSFVSPSVGTALLYPGQPTVPGYRDARPENVHGADIGAMMWQNLPYSTVQHRALFHDGELPLWNRYNSAGVTLLGQGQSMFGDPLHLLVIAANGATWAWDIKFVLAKALFAAGLGLCVWRLTRDLSAAGLVAIAAPFIGFYNYRVNHPAIFSVSYAPWILCAWAWLAAAEDGRRLRKALLLWLAANTAELASGSAKEAHILLLTLNVTGALGWLLMSARGGAAKFKHGAIIMAAGLFWALMTMPLWLTFVEALRQAHTQYDMPQVVQAPRAWLIGLFDDIFFREIIGPERVYTPAGNFLFLCGFLWALTAPRRLFSNSAVLACATATVIAILIAFGFAPRDWILATPILRHVYHVNNDFSAVALTTAIVVAGWGFHLARKRLTAPRAWLPGTVVFAMIAGLLVVYFRDQPSLWIDGHGLGGWWRRAPAHMFFYANLAAMLAAIGILAVLAARCERRPASWGSAVLVTLALAALLYRHGLHLPGMNWGGGYLNLPAVRASLTVSSPAIEFVKHDSSEPARVVGIENALFPGFASVYGLEGINGPDAIMNRNYREFAEAAQLVGPADWRFFLTSSNLPVFRPILDFLGVRYVLGNHLQLPTSDGYTNVAALDLDVYRSPTAWPRAFFTDQIAPYETPAELVQMIETGDGRPFAAMQTDDSDRPPDFLGQADNRHIIPGRNYRLTANTTAFDVTAPGPGVIVLNEAWLANDFKATLDGKPAPYLRINDAFKGVAVTVAGSHHVEFSYWPEHFTLALVLSAAGILLLAGLWLIVGVAIPPNSSSQVPSETTIV